MTGVENHHSLVGQHKEGRVVMIIGLEVRANQYIGLTMLHPVILRSFHVAVNINIAHISSVD